MTDVAAAEAVRGRYRSPDQHDKFSTVHGYRSISTAVGFATSSTPAHDLAVRRRCYGDVAGRPSIGRLPKFRTGLRLVLCDVPMGGGPPLQDGAHDHARTQSTYMVEVGSFSLGSSQSDVSRLKIIASGLVATNGSDVTRVGYPSSRKM